MRGSARRTADDPPVGTGGIALDDISHADTPPHQARYGADGDPETALAESYDRQVRRGRRRREQADPEQSGVDAPESWDEPGGSEEPLDGWAEQPEPWDGDRNGSSWDRRAGEQGGSPGGVELTRARLLSFTPYQPKRDRLCTDTASLLRPLVRAGIIDTWATDHSYPSHRAWKLLPSRLAMPRQLPLDGYVEPDGGITLLPLPDSYDEPPLCMLDWVIDWTAAGRLDSRWWTTAVHVTASAGLPPTGTLRP
jgi:hypothetical protein